MSDPITITLCMGSSCFSRGNADNLPRIQQFLAGQGLAARVGLRGCRCGGRCSAGPNMWVNGALRTGVTGSALEALLESLTPERLAVSPASSTAGEPVRPPDAS